jgi:predicted RNA-binding protein with PUA-like domain|tara:strand:- start:5 stop:475 length:471 start_codon:yes stop_codon:yes gene_type:complete
MSERKYWLMKSEPDVFGIDDMEKAGVEPWDGIRNYAARNYLRDEMKIGDKVFFYHSNAKPMAIVGTMEVASEPYPDPTQFDPKAKYFDPKSKESDPKWHLVDVRFVQKFEHPVTREAMKEESALDNMELFRLSRLSITPVREEEWNKIMEMAGVKG